MRPLRAVAAASVLAVVATVIQLGALAPSSAAELGAVTVSKKVERAHVERDGTVTTVESRDVKLTVSQTKDLRSRQPVRVSWSGAKPTQGTIGDPNSGDARLQEYPFLLIQCRGVDSTSVPVAQRLRPETCWTGSSVERVVVDYQTGFPGWRLDRHAPAAERTSKVGVPDPLPASCTDSFAEAERWVPFTAADGTQYLGGNTSCAGSAPEAADVGNAAQPPNTTYAQTQLNGTGSTKFTVWTAEDNASLGCASTVPCSLVAVPITGVSCDLQGAALPAADRAPGGSRGAQAEAECKSTGNYAPGEPRIGGSSAQSVTGALWWSESNWRNRITVPLSFAPLAGVCDIVGARQGVDVYGSELVAPLTSQWRPAFCTNSARVPFKHVQLGEPQAANLLKTDNVKAAFTSFPPVDGYDVPVVQAPLALTGFAIGYAIDGEDKREYRDLKLNARLIAKLLSNSYPGLQAVQAEYAALSANPLDISRDPEFIAFNPGIKQGVGASVSASSLLSLAGESDVIRSLTTYMDSDPDARAFLDGSPDPWGTVVNPTYKGIDLPVLAWPQKDAFQPEQYYDSGINECLNEAPVPIFPLINAPTGRIANIDLALQFASSQSQLICQTVAGRGAEGAKLVAQGRQSPGFRFVVGVTSTGDAFRYGLDTASLLTRVAEGAPVKPTDTTGRTFVAGDDAGLKAAVAQLAPDAESGTWRLPPAAPRTAEGAKAYPGTMVVSLAAPTTGLTKEEATGISGLMRYAAGEGQVQGTDIGQLPVGYVPLTAANGAGPLAAYTVRAAAAVAAQKGAEPGLLGDAVVPPAPGSPGSPAAGGSGGSSGEGFFPGDADFGTDGATGGTPVAPGTTAPGAAVAGPLAQAPVLASARPATPTIQSRLAGAALPAMLILSILTAAGAFMLNGLGRPRTAS